MPNNVIHACDSHLIQLRTPYVLYPQLRFLRVPSDGTRTSPNPQMDDLLTPNNSWFRFFLFIFFLLLSAGAVVVGGSPWPRTTLTQATTWIRAVPSLLRRFRSPPRPGLPFRSETRRTYSQVRRQTSPSSRESRRCQPCQPCRRCRHRLCHPPLPWRTSLTLRRSQAGKTVRPKTRMQTSGGMGRRRAMRRHTCNHCRRNLGSSRSRRRSRRFPPQLLLNPPCLLSRRQH